MGTLLLEKIATLVTVTGNAPGALRRSGAEMNDIGVLHDVDLLVDGETIASITPSGSGDRSASTRLDCSGKTVLPGFVDSHTHIVHAGDRSDEFAKRLRGASYQEIATAGGGILSTMRAVRSSSQQEIVDHSSPLLERAFRHGTTTIEAKSGYGLDTDNELKLLRAIRQLAVTATPTLLSTFLGAHDFPPEHREDHGPYIEEIIERMLPQVAEEKLAEFCDVFSDTGYYTVEESERIFAAARSHGLPLRVHADELSSFGGAEMAARIGALSADHLLRISDEGIERMKEANVVGTLLPGTAFFLNLPYAPARTMIDRGMTIALATDCNPGSNMCENMQMTLALACMGMRMSIEEAITAATINGAAALGLSDTIGSIEPGKKADLAIFATSDYPAIVYHYGVNQVVAMVKDGTLHQW